MDLPCIEISLLFKLFFDPTSPTPGKFSDVQVQSMFQYKRTVWHQQILQYLQINNEKTILIVFLRHCNQKSGRPCNLNVCKNGCKWIFFKKNILGVASVVILSCFNFRMRMGPIQQSQFTRRQQKPRRRRIKIKIKLKKKPNNLFNFNSSFFNEILNWEWPWLTGILY